jgi:hypothetical protein
MLINLHKLLLAFVVFLVIEIHSAQAQNPEKIETDRPGRAQTPFVAPKHSVQVETGFEWLKQDENEHSWQHPEFVIKYGLFKHLEVRARILSVTDRFKQPSYSQSGIEPVELGFKALLTEGKGVLPHTSVTGEFGIPRFASKDYVADKFFPKLRLNFENDITKKLFLEYNVAADWDGFEDKPEWMIVVSPHAQLGEKWQIFTEIFEKIHSGSKPEVSSDAGVSYWINNDCMLDVSYGLGISETAPKSFVDVGFSFRFK